MVLGMIFGNKKTIKKNKKPRRKPFTETIKANKLKSQSYQCANFLGIAKGMDATKYVCPIPDGKFYSFNNKHMYDSDHIEEVCIGGKSTIDNCQLLCLTCHRVKTQYLKDKNKKATIIYLEKTPSWNEWFMGLVQ